MADLAGLFFERGVTRHRLGGGEDRFVALAAELGQERHRVAGARRIDITVADGGKRLIG